MNSRALSVLLAICISLVVVSVVVRTGMFVSGALLPLYEVEVMQVPADPL